MRLRLWQKLILFICVFSVLAFSFALSVGATNYIEDDGSVIRPLFAPKIITIHSAWPETVCIDVNNSLAFPRPISVGYSSSTVISVDNSYNAEIALNQLSIYQSLYGYDYINFSYVIELNDLPSSDYAPTEYIDFNFTDIYLSSEVLNHLDFFGGINVYLDTDANEYTGTYYCEWDEMHIDENGEFREYHLWYEFDSFNDLLYRYSSSDFPNGVYLSNIVFTTNFYPPNEFTSGFYISGSSPYVSINSIPSPLNIWSDFFGDSIVVSPDRPLTILESIEVGLDAVWNTSLFGLFTIGTVFSACAGVALFAWLLKIFNR